ANLHLIVITAEKRYRTVGAITASVPGPVDDVFRIVSERILNEAPLLFMGRVRIAGGTEWRSNDNLARFAHAAKPSASIQDKCLRIRQWLADVLNAGRRPVTDNVEAFGKRCFRRTVEVDDSSGFRECVAPLLNKRTGQRFTCKKDPSQLSKGNPIRAAEPGL